MVPGEIPIYTRLYNPGFGYQDFPVSLRDITMGRVVYRRLASCHGTQSQLAMNGGSLVSLAYRVYQHHGIIPLLQVTCPCHGYCIRRGHRAAAWGFPLNIVYFISQLAPLGCTPIPCIHGISTSFLFIQYKGYNRYYTIHPGDTSIYSYRYRVHWLTSPRYPCHSLPIAIPVAIISRGINGRNPDPPCPCTQYRYWNI